VTGHLRKRGASKDGEELVVTVSGRPAAVLGPATPTQWRRYADIASVFVGLADARWVADRERLDADAHDRG
jgi:antitoxin (DNA-binding transcriptional repressor) of toxin-antitoxin stability system